MDKNTFIDSRQPLLVTLKDRHKLTSIRQKLQSTTGGIYKGTIPDAMWGRNHLGETYDKVMLASSGVEETFANLDDYTVLGGWCALRTKDLQNMQQGYIVNPATGANEIIRTVNQVSTWIRKAISLDQIVETVGLYNGTNYVLISEVDLWTNKIIRYLEQHLSRQMTKNEITLISDAIEEAEETRYAVTLRYIQYTKGSGTVIKRVRDKDIYPELQLQRDNFLASIGTSLPDLTAKITQNRNASYSDNAPNLANLERYVDDYTIVLTMYTGHYLTLLQEMKYVNTPYALIIEPWTHIRANNEAMAYCNEKMFSRSNGKNNYLSQGGFNAKLAFIATTEACDYNFIPDKVAKDINQIPNLVNYHEYLLSNYGKASIHPPFSDNNIFSFTYNYYPYGACHTTLTEVLTLFNKQGNRFPDAYLLNQSANKIIAELQEVLEHIFTI